MSKVVKYYYSRPIDVEINFICDGKKAGCVVGQTKRYAMAAIYDEDNRTIKLGVSTCMPTDNFCKAVGREIAAHNAETNPFYVIKDFNGRRNDYADEVLTRFIEKEKKLRYKDLPKDLIKHLY